MTEYNATIELDKRPAPTGDGADWDSILDALPGMSGSVGLSERGWLEVVITLEANSLQTASNTAIVLVENATKHQAISAEVMPTAEYDKRLGLAPMPELVSVTEAAESLGVSRQAVLDRIARHTLPATKVGREYVIPAEAVSV